MGDSKQKLHLNVWYIDGFYA